MQIQPQIPKSKPRRPMAINIAAFFFMLSLMGFMAQAFVDMYFASIESVTNAPLHVIFVWFALLCLFANRNAVLWMVSGKGRETIYLSVPLVLVILSYDLAKGWGGFRAFLPTLYTLTGYAVYLVAFVLSSDEVIMKRVFRIWFTMAVISCAISAGEILLGIKTPWSVYLDANSTVHHGGGLENTPVATSYSVVFPVTAAAIVTLSKIRPSVYPGRLFCLITAGVGLAGIVASASRSGLLGVTMGTGVGFLLLGRARKTVSALTLGGVGVVLLVATNVSRFVQKQGIEGDARLSDTWAAYLPIAITKPFGVGRGATMQDLIEAMGEAELLLNIKIDAATASLAYSAAPHNAWLTVAVFFGWLGAITLFVVYAAAFTRAFLTFTRSRLEPEERVLLVTQIGGMIAYMGHSLFHNAGIFMGDMRGFIPLAVFVSTSIGLAHRSRQRLLEQASAAQASPNPPISLHDYPRGPAVPHPGSAAPG